MSFSCWSRSGRASPSQEGRRSTVVLSAALASALFSNVVRADTFTAGNASGLISAMNAANKAGGSHTIVLAAGGNYDLKSANNATYGPTGLPVVGGAKAVSLTILGNGATIRRVGDFSYNRRGLPNNPFRLLAVAAGSSLTLDNIKATGGWANSAPSAGAAVYNLGALTVRNGSVFLVNYAGQGGAIFNAGGTVAVSDSQFVRGTTTSGKTVISFGNFAGYGGAIYNDAGAVSITNSSVTGSGANMFGGAVYNNGGTVVVSHSTLSDNDARFGGGVYNYGGSLTLANGCIVSGNEAFHADYPWLGGDGGGVYNAGGAVTISASTLSGNVADPWYEGSGGGLYNAAGTVTVRDASAITGNTSSGVGADVNNLDVLYLDGSSTIGLLDGNPPIPM